MEVGNLIGPHDNMTAHLCFHMAHLKAPDRMPANSGLDFNFDEAETPSLDPRFNFDPNDFRL